jgi:hypothetical protein
MEMFGSIRNMRAVISENEVERPRIGKIEPPHIFKIGLRELASELAG